MKVHATLGNGFQEIIYQRALAIEMKHEGLLFEREHNMKIYYRVKKLEKEELIFLLKEKEW